MEASVNTLKYWVFYRDSKMESSDYDRVRISRMKSELGRPPVDPADRPHHGSQCSNRTNHRQHEKTHHQEERSPYIVEDNMVHICWLLCRFGIYPLCHPQLHSQGDIGSRLVSHRLQQGQCLVHTCLLP